MKNILSALLLTCAVGLAAAQKPPVIEIKGIRLGMLQADAEKLFPQYQSDFTIGGALDVGGFGPALNYDKNNALISFVMTIKASSYETVKDAVKSKYPTLRCQKSAVQTRMGAQFEQETCWIENGDDFLSLTRYWASLDESRITMRSKSAYESSQAEEAKKKKDF